MGLGTRAVLVIGIQAAGKSSVGAALAARLERAAFIEGDVLWRMVMSGRVDMASGADDEARRQLKLRYRHGAVLAESFVAHGFTAIHVDNMYGRDVAEHLAALRCPRSLIVLRPRPDEVVRREQLRGSDAYARWAAPGESLLDVVRRFDGWLAESPRVGLWIDSSDQTVDETVSEILDRWEAAAVRED